MIDNQVWHSNENVANIDGGLAASCEDLSPKQTYVRKMNYSESENDFQALRIDETLFENPCSRSKSEAHLSQLGASKTINRKELLEFYDMDKPQNSPRKKDYFSTGDMSVSKLATNVEALLQEEPESPEKSVRDNDNQQLTDQHETTLSKDNQQQTNQSKAPESSSHLDQQFTNQHDIVQSTSQENSQHDVQQSANQQDTDQSSKQQLGGQHGIQQSMRQTDNQHKDFQDGDSQTSTQPSQDDNTSDSSDGSLRERLTGTPDSGVVLSSEETSSQDQPLIKQEDKHDESDGATESTTTNHSSPKLSTISSASLPTSTDLSSFAEARIQPRSNKDTWEPVANRKQRYLEMIEQDTVIIKSQPLTRKQNYKPEQTSPLLKSQRSPKSLPLVRKRILPEDQESEKDSDFEELLSSSQPILNLTNDEEPKPKQQMRDNESDSDSEADEMHTPLVPKIIVTKTIEAKDGTHTADYVNPSLSESSSDDDEMVKPASVVIYRSPVKTAKREQHRASHPPLQRTIRNEYFGSGVMQHSKKRKHKPQLNSIIEEDH